MLINSYDISTTKALSNAARVQYLIKHFDDVREAGQLYPGKSSSRQADLETLLRNLREIDWAKPVGPFTKESKPNREHVKQMLPFIEAYANGAIIKCGDTVVKNPAFDGNPSTYTIVEPKHKNPPRGQSWHNPQNVTARQIPAGYKMLTKKQFAALEDGPVPRQLKYFTSTALVFCNVTAESLFYDYTYIIPDDFGVFISPQAPTGFHWHHKDAGWTAKELPPGYRPLIEGETVTDQDEMFDEGHGAWIMCRSVKDDLLSIGESVKIRTKRHIPATCKEIVKQRKLLEALEKSL